MTSNTPRVITRSDPSQVRIEWSDGHETVYTAGQLRAICPCARCVDEMSGVRTHDPASVPADLTQKDLTMVGNYAISLQFSDTHNTGIFPFTMLRLKDPGQTAEESSP